METRVQPKLAAYKGYIYYSTLFVTMALLALASGHLTRYLEIATGWHVEPVARPLSLCLCGMAAYAAAIGICKFLGVSAEHQEIEVFGPFVNTHPQGCDLTIERHAEAYIAPVIGAVCTCVLAAFLFGTPQPILYYLLGIPVLMGLAIGTGLSWKNRKTPALNITPTTIQSCDPSGVLCKSALWADIDTCEVKTAYNVLGKFQTQTLTFKHKSGKVLLQFVVNADREWAPGEWVALVNLVRGKQPQQEPPVT